MMLILLLILGLGFAVAILRLPVFETTVGLLLLTPVLAFPLGKLIGLGWYTYLIVGAGLLQILWVVQLRRVELSLVVAGRWRSDRAEFVPIAVWVGVTVVAYLLCLLWPDFISIGERLRDYALLSSVLQHPLEAREPWMSGAVLNYYLFWYRFGAMLASVGGLPVWQTYHLLQSVTVGLYCAIFFRLFSRQLNFAFVPALGCAALITFGSNLSGVVAYARQDSNWWGPSRVIPGTINEFPAWSFLLGDLHPHFLNLPLLPALLLLSLKSARLWAGRSLWLRMPALLACVAMVVAWTFAANAWELPFALSACGVLALGAALCLWRNRATKAAAPAAGPVVCVAAIVLMGGVAGLLRMQSVNITPPGDPLRLVTLPIAPESITAALLEIARLFHLRLEPPIAGVTGSPMGAFLLHWGLPLGLISISLIVLSRDWIEGIAKAAAILFGYLSGAAVLLLSFIGILQLWRMVQRMTEPDRDSNLTGSFVVELLGFAALLGIVFPEVAFVDDPYGGADERMNTVFKFYSAAWGFLHLAAFALAAEALRRFPRALRSAKVFWAGWAVILTLFLGFFVSSMKYRVGTQFTLQPYSQGLSSIENQFSGVGVAIQKLERMQRGVVLEAQGGAYNLSSLVA
ncbi:MAG: hypothetical protein EBZ48_05475, partial [Proteobacteria bacterium]|nr:hypothetical protein [Pseudomonadota bacterium]